MTARDRIVLIGVVVLALLGAAWILVVSPERKQAAGLATQVGEAQTQLASAEGKLANARADESQYSAAYASVVSLGKAVPPDQEVPSLIYQLAQVTKQKNVDFASIATGSGTGGSSSSVSATATTTALGFTQMPFTFVFNGSFFDLEHLFHKLTAFTDRTPAGSLRVSGRLLTVQSVKLAPLASSEKGAQGGLTGTITATAYVLPAGQGLTGAGSAAAPAGSPASTTSGASSSPSAPAIARVTP